MDYNDRSKSEKNKFSLKIFKEILKNSIRVGKIVWQANKKLVVLLVLALIFISASPFFISGSQGLLVNELVESLGTNDFSQGLMLALSLLIASSVLLPILRIFESYLIKQSWFFFSTHFETLVLEKKGEIDVAVYENPKYNDLFQTVQENGWWRLQNFADRQFYVFQNILEVIIALIVLSFSHWWLLVVLFLGTIYELISEIKFGRDVWNIHSGNAVDRRKFYSFLTHFTTLNSLIELKLFQNTGHFISLIKDILFSFREKERRAEQKKLFNKLAASLISEAAVVVAIIWLVFEVVGGNIQIGTFIFFLAAIGSLRGSLAGLFMNLGRQYQDNLFVTDIFKVLDLEPAIDNGKGKLILPGDGAPQIDFENVSFTYPGTKTPVLKNISLSIPAGEKIALIGVNGAGKTTLIKLLCRFYDPTKGRILIDGKDLKEINLESWYTQLGAIFQDYSHYHFLVNEVIALGNSSQKKSMEKVERSAKEASADVFIEEWEEQYSQMLGKEFERGVEPSVGQWQKLALARVFYRDPKVLILDEPTSSIDAEAEAKIFERLEKLSKNRTAILISHRFSTVRQADQIAVIENGSISEQGTHEQLIENNQTYARLFRLQAKGYQ